MDERLGTLKGTTLLSGVNERLEPFIQIRVTAEVGGREITLLGQASPAELRTMGLNHLAVAEAAESDSLVARYLHDDVGLDLDAAARMIGALREHRDQALADMSIVTVVET